MHSTLPDQALTHQHVVITNGGSSFLFLDNIIVKPGIIARTDPMDLLQIIYIPAFHR